MDYEPYTPQQEQNTPEASAPEARKKSAAGILAWIALLLCLALAGGFVFTVYHFTRENRALQEQYNALADRMGSDQTSQNSSGNNGTSLSDKDMEQAEIVIDQTS